MNRRSLLTSALVMFAGQRLPLPGWIGPAAAEEKQRVWRHGLAKFGELKYPAGFKQFEYVNPSAPKTGAASQVALGTFDNFNPVVSGVKGTLVQGIDFVFDTLLTSALDEVYSVYGLLAESVSFPEDLSSVTFRLRPEAKWQDGKPVTPDDVIFSYNAYKKGSPQAAANYRHVVKAEKTAVNDVTFVLDGTASQELPIIIGQLTIMPKHWWEDSDKDGRKRSIEETTLEMPLGSGPYKIKEFSPAHAIIYERVKDYWGTNVNVNVGRNNFDELKFEYFRDATVAIEAFKGDLVDWRAENSAKNWSTAYDFPAVAEKRVILQEFPINNIGVMQAFAFNLRRNKFKDPRVRQAFNYAFDFEEMNKKIFFGQYKRTGSYFEGTELAASGLPTGRELELLETVRDKVPPELFKVEFLANAPLFERIFLFYKPALERLGITVSVRTVDQPQYENRLRKWDFDVITFAWGESLLPGNEQRGYWGSQAADQSGSDNILGIKNPAVDEMITRIISAKTRDELVAATRALDRILLWNNYVVPQWGYGKLRTARWNRFSYRDPLPKYGMSGFPALWWWDAEKAAKTGGKRS